MMRNMAIMAGVFLLGFIPPFVWNLQTKRDLAQAQRRLDLAEARELAALSYMEATRNNFGLASQHASSLFSRLGALAASAEEPVRSVAAGASQKRDTVMSMLAKADPQARSELQEMVGQLYSTEVAGSGVRARTQ
jgi:hypothetical protein